MGSALLLDERQREVRLGELLLGVVEEPGVAHVGVRPERALRLGQVRRGLGDQRPGFAELAPVHGADRRRARSDRTPRRGERDLPRRVLLLEDGPRRLTCCSDLTRVVQGSHRRGCQFDAVCRRGTSRGASAVLGVDAYRPFMYGAGSR